MRCLKTDFYRYIVAQCESEQVGMEEPTSDAIEGEGEGEGESKSYSARRFFPEKLWILTSSSLCVELKPTLENSTDQISVGMWEKIE